MTRIFLSALALSLLWVIGFILFVRDLPSAGGPTPPEADAVVVYTGGGARISAGMELMAKGAARRLLISGVNPQSRDDIARMWTGPAETFACCVDLGEAALTTEGNAAELRAWADDHDIRSIILVTSDYHMPRALVETHARMPDVAIAAYAAPSEFLDAQGRPVSRDAWRALAFEYSKYLAARVKTLLRIGL